jgi:DNA-binding MarR family transcriptional regulator
MPHAYYMILVALSEAAERTMTLTELAVVTRSSASRLSHAMNRLEAQGWVTRCRHPADGRTTLARLTDTGFDALADAAPGHVSEVRRVLFDPLSPEQVHQLRSICQTILNGLGSAPPAR